MPGDLDPDLVAARLAVLRACYVPETIEEGQQRLARDVPHVVEPFERQVEQRLAELRALDELARYLHRKQ